MGVRGRVRDQLPAKHNLSPRRFSVLDPPPWIPFDVDNPGVEISFVANDVVVKPWLPERARIPWPPSVLYSLAVEMSRLALEPSHHVDE